MSTYTKKDMSLLTEAYNLKLLKEEAPSLTLDQLKGRLTQMNESELKYITDVSDKIINEFWGGAGALGKSIGSGLGSIKKGISNAAAGAAGAVGQAGTKALDTAKGVGRGLKTAGSQVAKNASDIYNTGNVEAEAGTTLEKAQLAVNNLIDYMNQAQQQGLIKVMGDVNRYSLDRILTMLIQARDTAESNANTAQSGALGGFGKGVGGAFKQGFNS